MNVYNQSLVDAEGNIAVLLVTLRSLLCNGRKSAENSSRLFTLIGRAVVILCCMFSNVWANESQEDQLGSMIDRSLGKAVAIAYHVKVDVETWEPKTEQWIEEGASECEGLFDLVQGGRLKIQYDLIKSTWENGAAPFYETKKTVAYDGNTWISYIDEAGPLGQMRQKGTADVYDGSQGSKVFIQPVQSAQEFVLTLLRLGDRVSVIDLLRPVDENRLNHLSIDISVLSENRFTWTANNEDIKMVEDIELFRNSPFVKSRNYTMKTPTRTRHRKFSMEPSANGEGQSFTFQYESYIDERPLRRVKGEISNIKLLYTISNKDFQMPLPVGTRVVDYRHNLAFTVGDHPEILADKISELLERNEKPDEE